MGNSHGGGSGRKTALATVYRFPKRRPPPRKRADSGTMKTVADFELHDVQTEPAGVAIVDGRSRRRRTPTPGNVRIQADPTLQHHREAVSKVLTARPRRKTPQQKPAVVSREQVVGMSMYGHELFEQGKLEEARVVFEGLVGMGVEDAYAHTMLGTIYLARGDQDRALALFEAALGISSKDTAARVYRGEIRLNRGQTKAALEDFQAALRGGDPADPFVERARRLVELAKGQAGGPGRR